MDAFEGIYEFLDLTNNSIAFRLILIKKFCSYFSGVQWARASARSQPSVCQKIHGRSREEYWAEDDSSEFEVQGLWPSPICLHNKWFSIISGARLPLTPTERSVLPDCPRAHNSGTHTPAWFWKWKYISWHQLIGGFSCIYIFWIKSLREKSLSQVYITFFV